MPSLVGSEMCIRDRLIRLSSLSSSFFFWVFFLGRGVACISEIIDDLSVAYTWFTCL